MDSKRYPNIGYAAYPPHVLGTYRYAFSSANMQDISVIFNPKQIYPHFHLSNQ